MRSLPLFYYPSTIVWVDDDSVFMSAMSEYFKKEYALKIFNQPKSCLKFFEENQFKQKNHSFLKGILGDDYYETAAHSPVDLNVPALHQAINVRDRTEEVSVIIVDYNMPEMNGIKLCEQLKDHAIKKILLTGEAELDEAVSAFNDNIIDRFIRKDNPQLIEQLKKYIQLLTLQYFREKTLPLLSHLEADTPIALSDPIFVEYFKSWCDQQKIAEYSIIDKQGSMLALSQDNRQYYCVVHTDRTLNSFVRLNDDVGVSEHLLSSIQSAKKIPFFGIGKESWEFEVSEWENYLYSPSVIEGREKYYWAVLT